MELTVAMEVKILKGDYYRFLDACNYSHLNYVYVKKTNDGHLFDLSGNSAGSLFNAGQRFAQTKIDDGYTPSYNFGIGHKDLKRFSSKKYKK